jgi:hypothetical protein
MTYSARLMAENSVLRLSPAQLLRTKGLTHIAGFCIS